MNTIHYIIVTVAFLLAGATNTAAQTDRNLIRQGNRAFKTQKWAAAETQYRKAISKNQNIQPGLCLADAAERLAGDGAVWQCRAAGA